MNLITRYWHTVRYLRFQQISMRVFYKIWRPRIGIIDLPLIRDKVNPWTQSVQRKPSLLGCDNFLFIGQSGALKDVGWDGLYREKLWRYNQHYFDDLNACDSNLRITWHRRLLEDWILKNPPCSGTGWEPYPTSLRLVNWIKWALAGNSLETFEGALSFNKSLVTQARWLSRRLEFHILGNHLFANAKALVFAGLYFQGAEANAFLKTGLQIISTQLDEQVLNDGGNFERTPMYHAIFLEDLLDLINLSCVFPAQIDSDSIEYWRIVAKKMLCWLKFMTHPDGQITFFNDAAFGIAPPFSDLSDYANRLGISFGNNESLSDQDNGLISLHHFKDSGYIRLASKNAIAFLDVAPIGPDYLPGHAHADTLSFELSMYGRRVIVNGGTSCYGLSVDRIRERQTLSHSTVEINGQSSSEVWSSFRVARRAYPFDLDLFVDSTKAIVSCSHDGYRRLVGRPIHRRTWEAIENSIKINDVIKGPYSKAIARFIIHPQIAVCEITRGVFQLKLPEGSLVTFLIHQGLSSLEHASYSPEFGKTIDTNCISVKLDQGASSIEIKWV